MQVKVFERVVSLSPGSGGEDGLHRIEAPINDWLAKNPLIEVADVRLACCAAPLEHSPTHFTALCLIFYREAHVGS